MAVVDNRVTMHLAEFITSSRGIGYEISYAYNNFDNQVMYPLIFLILAIVTVINMSLYAWERRLLACDEPCFREPGGHQTVAGSHARVERFHHAAHVFLQPACGGRRDSERMDCGGGIEFQQPGGRSRRSERSN